MKETSSKKDDKDSGTVDSSNPNPNIKSGSESKSYSRSRSRSASKSKSKSKSQSKSKSKSRSSKNSQKSSEEKPVKKDKKTVKESKDKLQGEEEKKSTLPAFPGFMNPQPFNHKHFPLGQMQGGLFGPPYGAPFLPIGPLHFSNFFRPPPQYYKPGPNKKFMSDDGEKPMAPNLLQNLGVLKPLRIDKRGGIANIKDNKKKSQETPLKSKKSVDDIVVFKKFNAIPTSTEIFLTLQAFLQYADQNLYMNMSKKLLSEFEKKCKENKMKTLAKSLGRYMINFNEMIKKEKEKESKESKETKKKGKDGKVTEDKDSEASGKLKDFEIIKWLHENKNMQDLVNKVSLEGFKLDEWNVNLLEKCGESKSVFEESKELFLKKFK